VPVPPALPFTAPTAYRCPQRDVTFPRYGPGGNMRVGLGLLAAMVTLGFGSGVARADGVVLDIVACPSATQ
jgi:hypothetical protein